MGDVCRMLYIGDLPRGKVKHVWLTPGVAEAIARNTYLITEADRTSGKLEATLRLLRPRSDMYNIAYVDLAGCGVPLACYPRAMRFSSSGRVARILVAVVDRSHAVRRMEPIKA